MYVGGIDQGMVYTNRKAYQLFADAAVAVGRRPHKRYSSGRRNANAGTLSYPSRLSVYDGLFGGVYTGFFGWTGIGERARLPASYVRLASRIVTAMYLGSERWKDAVRLFPSPANWVDTTLVNFSRRWITEQIRGHKGLGGKNKGYDLPEPIPLSQVIFEEFGVDPLSSARDFIYTSEEIESILRNGWYPRELFRDVMSFGGAESFRRGVRVLVVREDFVPRVPISFLSYDRYVADAIYYMYDFVNRVWENPDILDDISRFVVYRRVDLYRDGRSLPVVLPDFGLLWGWLLYSMVWYVMSKFDSGIFNLHAQSSNLAKYVESALGTYYLFPAVSPFRVHGNFYPYMVRELMMRWNHIYYDGVRFHEEDSYGELGLRSAWRYYQPSRVELLAGVRNPPLAPVPSIKSWFESLGFNWLFGFGYIERVGEGYHFHFGDPYTSYAPTPVVGYSFEAFSPSNLWFNYRSVPFFEFMRKFVFMYLEVLRRHGRKIVGSVYARDGVVDIEELFGAVSPAFRDIPEDLLEYSDPSQFEDFPFHVVFNMAMSIFPAVLYADVLPFRVYHHHTLVYVWNRMHHMPNIRSRVREDGTYVIEQYDPTKLFRITRWFPRMTYAATTKAFVGDSYRRFSGDLSALSDSYSFSVLNSWYMPGVLMYRLPYYDSATVELLLNFMYNYRSSVNWTVVDATGGEKNVAFFDDSSTRYIPYGIVPAFVGDDDGVTPVGLVALGYADHLFVWVARALSNVCGKWDVSRSILDGVVGVFGASGLRGLRRHLRGCAKDTFERYLSELQHREQGDISKDGGAGGSSSEPSSLNSRDPQ